MFALFNDAIKLPYVCVIALELNELSVLVKFALTPRPLPASNPAAAMIIVGLIDPLIILPYCNTYDAVSTSGLPLAIACPQLRSLPANARPFPLTITVLLPIVTVAASCGG